MDRKKKSFVRKVRSSSRISSRARTQEDAKTNEESVPPNTQVDSPKHTPSKSTHSSMLPFGKPVPKKTSTARQRRPRQVGQVFHIFGYSSAKKRGQSLRPNTQVDSPKHTPSKSTHSSMLPFGKPVPKKTSTARQRRPRQHSTIPPVRRCLYDKRESDSSSSHSHQESLQQSKQKLIEKSRQKAKTVKKQDEDASWMYTLDESTPVATAEEADANVTTACSVQAYEKGITACLKAFASMCETLTPDMLRQQFYSLPQPDPKECVVSGDPSNYYKNRYRNVPCLDSTRILLEFLFFEDGVGYIHANRVTYPLLRNEFILTQGPLPRTVPEFWRMIWQEKVETIIMLCKTIENGKRKCAEYFSNHPNTPLTCVNGQLTVYLR
ncbi:hypothetical protein GCK32_004302, partial [Trichostrongylus colubriformis]